MDSDPGINNSPSHYVGIGASAGGLEALEQLFQNLPEEAGVAFIVIQHLFPDYKSMMVELLSKKTRMAVKRAIEGMLVERNTIYLIPPKKNLTIFHGKLLLSDQPPHERWVNLPIDIFFRSLAEDQGDKAVGIILSGTGSDGSRGVRAIKEYGGMVMVQEVTDAKFDGMPKSASSTGMADFILRVDDMPEKLMAYVKYPHITKSSRFDPVEPDEKGLTAIFSLLRSKTRVDFTYYKPSTVNRRIERRMNVNQMQDLDAYIEYLRSNTREISILYRELLIGVTSFFRDREAYDFLAEKVLPELLKNTESSQLRIWVVGCSTGEEAYSLAILVNELCEDLAMRKDVKIFATDVDNDAILTAGSGIYPESIAADIGPMLLTKYFQRQDEHYSVSREIREMVVFAQHNIINDPPFTKIDIVSCRNLLIYLQPDLQKKAMSMFNFSLNRDGVLFLGNSETTGEMSNYFTARHHRWKIYQSKGRQSPLSDRPIPSRPYTARDHIASLTIPQGVQTVSYSQRDSQIIERFLKTITGDMLSPSVIVNQQLELLYCFGEIEQYLKIPAGKMENDIRKMLPKEIAVPLTIGIQKVFNTEKDITYKNIHFDKHAEKKTLDLVIKPVAATKTQNPLVVIFFYNKELVVKSSQDNESGTYDYDEETEQRLYELENELQYTKENLQATIEELETSNEELQATNEELLASNEELQSTNEELQSVNEELYTLNSEHQRKIMELTELNNDVDNLLISTEIGTLFLDEKFSIRKFTPKIQEVFNIIAGDIGRPFSHLTHRLHDMDIQSLVTNVIQTSKMIDRNVQTRDGKWFLLRILPYNIAPQTFAGVVITIVEVSDLIHTEVALEESMERLGLAEKVVRFASWQWNVETGSLSFTSSLEKLLGHRLNSLSRTYEAFLNCVHPEDKAAVITKVTSAVEKGENFEIIHRILQPSGTISHVKQIGVASPGSSGKAVRMTGIVLDVTHEKEHLDQKGANRPEGGKVEGTIPDGLIVIDQQGQILTINEVVESYFGYSSNDLVGENVSMLMPEPHRTEHDGYIQKYLDSGDAKIIGTGREVTALHKDGSEFAIQLSIGEIKIGKRSLFSGILQKL